MVHSLFQKDILAIKDLSLADIQCILETAKRLKQDAHAHLLQNKIVAHCFFEPSTRTRLSFESATLRLGGQVIGFSSDYSNDRENGSLTLFSAVLKERSGATAVMPCGLKGSNPCIRISV